MTATSDRAVASLVGQMIEAVVGTISSPIVAGIARFNSSPLPPRDAPHPLLTGIHELMTRS